MKCVLKNIIRRKPDRNDKMDGDTIQLNKKGQLFTRFFTSKEIKVVSKDLIKTQAEEKGYGHADTVLEEERPATEDLCFRRQLDMDFKSDDGLLFSTHDAPPFSSCTAMGLCA